MSYRPKGPFRKFKGFSLAQARRLAIATTTSSRLAKAQEFYLISSKNSRARDSRLTKMETSKTRLTFALAQSLVRKS